jgi:hypothetical protein
MARDGEKITYLDKDRQDGYVKPSGQQTVMEKSLLPQSSED